MFQKTHLMEGKDGVFANSLFCCHAREKIIGEEKNVAVDLLFQTPFAL